jgi:DNA-binding transcriptional regulator LsrR (DeoR family)
VSPRQAQKDPAQPKLDDAELEARVCQLVCEGREMREIVEIISESHPGINFTRQQPHRILRRAAKNGRIRYTPRPELSLAYKIKERYKWLKQVEVVHSQEHDHIADKAAEHLLDIIAGKFSGTGPKTDFHCGFAGGGLLELTARLLSEKLRQTAVPLPKTIYFHSMVARLDEDPALDPNSFVRYFTSNPPLPASARFVGLMAPGFVSVDTVKLLRGAEGIREAFARVKDLDVIVTSGGHWAHGQGCSRLYELYSNGKHNETLKHLETKECVGDLMWCPLGKAGPILINKGMRAMTLVELNDLPRLIQQNKSVILVLASCATCRQPKTDLLKTVLELPEHLITDLVVDSITARTVV